MISSQAKRVVIIDNKEHRWLVDIVPVDGSFKYLIFLEAGVGIEPAYTALQAAA